MPFRLVVTPGFKIFREPTSILSKNMNKDTIDDITLYLEYDDVNIFDFNGETLGVTVMLTKTKTSLFWMTSYDRLKSYFFCAGGKDHSSANIIEPAKSFNKKIWENINCSKAIRVYIKELQLKLFQILRLELND